MKERYLSKNDFKSEFCVIETKLSESSIEQAKIVKQAKENVELVKSVKQQMKEKADVKSVVQVVDKLKNYSTFKDLKELYGKVVPPLSEFEKSMQEFETGHQ